jgi:hypothetical protein
MYIGLFMRSALRSAGAILVEALRAINMVPWSKAESSKSSPC